MGKEKITNANSFPKDWPIKKLADIGSTYGGLTNKSKEDFAEGNSKFITYKNIYNNTFINTNELESVRIYKDEKQNKVKYGDVFFTGSSETPDEVGISSVLLEEVDDVYLNSFCFGFRFNDLKKTIPEFYGYYFRGPVFRNEVYPLAQGSTRFNLSKSEMIKLKVPVPPVKEQYKIAAILSSVDEAIEKTKAIIEQTEKVKKGLMQQLLTKGIGHTKFKKTEIGEIPEEWEVLEVADVAKTTSGGTPSRNNPEYFNGSIPWIKTGELKEKYIYDTEEKITEEAVKNSSAKLVPKNSVIVAMYGATIGNVSINKIDATTNQACCVVIPQKERLNDEFLYYLLAFWKEKLIKLGAGGAQPNISQQIIKNLLIPMPSLKEQMEIANILAILDKKIQNEKKKFDSLSNLKKGLMQALLTGKVRVKVDNEVMSQ
ncbi:restriction endonuclease subunit S [Anoxybacillus flavithermus]|uniref:restriction endonuclease subunit S n=1 Tax=Anoxybacillus flavithermus TaxID=33934 RepID=UPI0018DFF5ED|nr:restriction endonuclease subunit S [Anoxybacillus flavithermus]